MNSSEDFRAKIGGMLSDYIRHQSHDAGTNLDMNNLIENVEGTLRNTPMGLHSTVEDLIEQARSKVSAGQCEATLRLIEDAILAFERGSTA